MPAKAVGAAFRAAENECLIAALLQQMDEKGALLPSLSLVGRRCSLGRYELWRHRNLDCVGTSFWG